jgi:hypothetical protein
VSDQADFFTQGGNMIAAGQTQTWVFWWDEEANPNNYQDVWLAVQNQYDINNSVPTLSISGFGTTQGSQDPSGNLHIIHWRTITNNLSPDSEPALFAYNLIQIPSGS